MFLIFVIVAHSLHLEVTPDMAKGIAPKRLFLLLTNTLVK